MKCGTCLSRVEHGELDFYAGGFILLSRVKYSSPFLFSWNIKLPAAAFLTLSTLLWKLCAQQQRGNEGVRLEPRAESDQSYLKSCSTMDQWKIAKKPSSCTVVTGNFFADQNEYMEMKELRL